MKKIGIVTWHYLDNYGSLLQTFAMSEILKDYDLDVQVVNYINATKNKCFKRVVKSILFGLIHFVKLNNKYTRRNKFEKFRKKNLKETVGIYDGESITKIGTFDYLLCGSDQIWCVNKFNEIYYLNFDNNAVKFSYAPSLIYGTFDQETTDKVVEILKDFKCVSTREIYGANYLSSITKRKVEVVLDPTLLLSREEWLDKINIRRSIGENYLVTYFLGENNDYSKQVIEYARKEKLKIVNIAINNSNQFGEYIIMNAGIEEFLSLLEYAEHVVTDSYHGILVSLILNKKFHSIKRFGENDKCNQNGRIEEILMKLRIENLLLDLGEEIVNCNIDYKKVNKEIEIHKKESLKYINRAIGKI